MNVSPNVNLERIEEADLKLQSQLNKCLNEKRRRQCEIGYLDELAGLISASASDMCSLSVKPDKCAILQETVNQIRRIKLAEESQTTNDLQQSEVSSSKPNILANDILGPLLLEALDGFLFMVNTDGKIEFVSENVKSFLNYSQENLIDKIIYNFIHHGDHGRFSSNLLPMSIGNGFGWNSEPNAAINKSRPFNCRFLIKPPEEPEETMEEKQTRVSQYENMQIAAVLLPFSGEKSESSELDSDVQNHLVCVARRIASNEKNNSSTVEQFTTRLDMFGKILTIDTNGISAMYSQYLNKDLVGRIIQDLCHPNDFGKLSQHLKETFQLGCNTSGVYRLRLMQDKYVQVQTKSKRFSSNPMANEEEFIIATHSIIRDSDQLMMDGSNSMSQRSNPSPVCGTVTPSLTTSMNGNSYSFSSMGSSEFNLNDIGLDMFPSSSWDLDNNDSVEATSIPASLSGTSTNTNAISSSQTAQSLAGNAFSPELMSNRESPPTQSPAQLSSTNSPATGRGTPFTNSFAFSPIQTQSVSRTASPSPTHANKKNSSSELSTLSPIDRLMSDNQDQSANVKLRNLLTHGIGEADSSISKNSDDVKMDIDVSDRLNYGLRAGADGNENFMLRELLNQEDEDINDSDGKNIHADAHSNMIVNVEPCSSDMLQRKHANDNNMLRKLLNSDEDNYRRSHHEPLIQQLLKNEAKTNENSLSALNKTGNGGFPSSVADQMVSIPKRKSPNSHTDEPLMKRQNMQHAHLAGQNPMLASMLAQTPRTAPSVPTSVANAIVSQLPQDRLPKNLEKKLVHTPYTASSSNTTTNSSQQYNFNNISGATRSLLSTSLQQEVVTADSRGHVTLAPQNNFSQGQGAFLNKMLSNMDNSQTSPMQMGNGNQFAPNLHQQPNISSDVNLIFADLTGETNINKPGPNADPLLSAIFEQVWSLEQDMIGDAPSSDDIALYKLLEDYQDPTPIPSPRPPPTAQEINEKMAITAIQRQLMSFETPGGQRITQFPQQQVSLPMAANPNQPQMTSNSYAQVNHYQVAPPAYTSSAMAVATQRTRAPNIHSMQSSGMQQMVQQNNQRHMLPQYNLSTMNIADLPPQVKRNLVERKKMYLQSQQKRLLIQQQKQQLANRQLQQMQENLQISNNSNQFPSDNIGDLINNAVAPNVTLQRSANLTESQLSPRYSTMVQLPNSTAGPPASPQQQLSPGQRQQPYSPLSQQPYANNYPPTRLSPHISPQPGANQQWAQRAQNQASLQQQNPMLNAQLSQGSFNTQVQSRFPNQQQQPPRQMVVRSMPSPGSRNSPFSNPPDSPFHPPSPGVALYQQQQQQSPAIPQQPPQQRLQRAVSIPNRVNSPRSLQAGYGNNDPLLSPQPSPGSYNSPVSNYNSSLSAPSSASFNPEPFGYDQQVYQNANIDRNRNSSSAMTSEYVRQELRAMVGARTQQQHQGHQQQHLMQQQQGPPGAPTSSHQSLSQSDFEALGFSLDLPTDSQPTSPALYSSSLLNVAGGNESQPPNNSPRFQSEEVRPAEPKKSLLQQLLSEPP